MIIRIIKNWKESRQSDLRRSIKPYFKGDSCRYSSFRSGAETYLTINHKGIILEFWQELGHLGVGINGIDVRESPLLSLEVKNKIDKLLSLKGLLASKRNSMIAELLSLNL